MNITFRKRRADLYFIEADGHVAGFVLVQSGPYANPEHADDVIFYRVNVLGAKERERMNYTCVPRTRSCPLAEDRTLHIGAGKVGSGAVEPVKVKRKGGCRMDSLEHLNRALDYIEAHLADDIEVREAARLAACSEYHFTRMFSFLSGVTLSEYIRRRRLTLAAMELTNGSARIIDVAVKYGYGSPDAFARAFHGLHGVTPSEARQTGQPLKAYPRMYFRLTIEGGNEMNYRIVDKPPFRIVGLMKRVPIVFHGVNPEIAAMWQSLNMEMIAELKRISNVEPQGLISASVHFSGGRMEEKGGLDHYIGAATTHVCPPAFEQLEVAAAMWAVFEAVGPFPDTLQHVWGRIYAEWFPSSEYELTAGPELLWNEHKDVASPTFRSEIWIPVVKRRGGPAE